MRSNLFHLLFIVIITTLISPMSQIELPIAWILVTSAYAFIVYGYDKILAKNHWMRVSENNLYFLAAIGGCFGAFLGMSFFCHKTKKTGFLLRFYIVCFMGLILNVFIVSRFY